MENLAKNKAKKILFLIFNLDKGGGAERVVADQIDGLDKNIFDCFLCVLNKDIDNNLLQEIKISKDNKKILNFKSLFDVSSWSEIIKWMRGEKFDIVYSHLFFANFVGRVAGKIAGVKKIIATEHNVYLDRRFLERFVNKLLSFFSYQIVAVSNSVKKYLIDAEGIREGRIRVIYNGIDFKKYIFDQQKRESLRSEFRLPREFVVMSAGQVSRQKNYELLIDIAYEINKKRKENIYFFIAGFDQLPLGGELKKKVEELNLSEFVNFLGFRDDIADLLSFADVGLMTSSWEGFGLALVEAMANGKPVVVNDIETLKEIVGENNDFGLVCHNKEEFAEVLIKLKKDKEFYGKYRDLSLERAKEFALEQNIKKLSELFLE